MEIEMQPAKNLCNIIKFSELECIHHHYTDFII